jgi:hypothetical protein
VDLLARTWFLWREFEARLTRYKPRRPLRELLREACGLELEDILTIAFALFAKLGEAEVGAFSRLDLGALGLPRPAVEKFLNRFSASRSELSAVLSGQDGEWALRPLEDKPLLRVGPTTVVVTDPVLLKRRFTHALYWLVHDHERDRVGDEARRAWTQVYSELVELYAEDLLQRLAPVLLGGGNAFSRKSRLGSSEAALKTAASISATLCWSATSSTSSRSPHGCCARSRTSRRT